MQALSEYEEGVLSPAQLTPLVLGYTRSVQKHADYLLDIKESVISIDARLSQVEQRLEVVDGRLDNIEESQHQVEVGLAVLRADTREGFQEMDRRFAAVDVRFDAMEAKHDTRFDAIEGQLAAIALAVNAGPPPEASSAGLGC